MARRNRLVLARRTGEWIFAALLVLAALWAVLVAFPQPLFAHRLTVGRLSLYSDRPFDAARAAERLKDIEARLETSPIDDRRPHAVFVANDEWRRKLIFALADGAAGVNYHPLTNNVFVRHADIEDDRVFGASGKPAEPPRTFAYYAAHEMAHSLTSERQGPMKLWNRTLPQWVREGYADYVGMGSKVDVDDLYRRYRAGDPDLDFMKSHTYARFRLLCAYLLERRHWTVDQLLGSRLPQAQAEALLAQGMGAAPDTAAKAAP